jgi:hypothetical protein
LQQLTATVNEQLAKFNSDFTNEKIVKTDMLYTKLMLFKNFVSYDFYFLLKQFDSSLRERNFNAVPKFQAIGGSYVVEDIKNFAALKGKNINVQEAMMIAQVQKALKGDTQAAQFIRDTIGEKAPDSLELGGSMVIIQDDVEDDLEGDVEE